VSEVRRTRDDRRHAAHDRVEYQQNMGHVWLGFSEKTIKKYLEGAGFEKASITALPADEAAKGPSLFVATALKK
jgi:ArsR family transcriptional regulator